MSTHTQGKWNFSKNVNDYSIYSDNNESKDIAAAYQYSRSIPEEEAQANAKLIAAAPELLEALEYYKTGIEHFYNCINFKKSTLDAEAIEFMNDSNIKITAALSKATK